ncbi:MAG TPA: response regulator [Ktedonobacterales bacterium]|nr:response regulator [Ktedonobacterales bacterium]
MDAVIAFESPPPTILVVEDNPQIGHMLQATLEAEGFVAVLAPTGEEGLAFALREVPQLLLLDLMLPGIDGFQVIERIRGNVKTSHIPVVILTARHDTADKMRAFASNADDFMTKPFNSDELLARIRTQLRHVRETLLSPLTHLPSGLQVERAIHQQILSMAPCSILYIDLDHFKAYNDVYGFLRGNDLIRVLARVATEAVRVEGNVTDFVGHIGGDDFVIITTPDRAEAICRRMIAAWDTESRERYNEEDWLRGTLVARDRQGYQQTYPLVSVSIGVVTNEHHPIASLGEVSQIAAEVKHKAKALHGSSYYVDRRGAGPGDVALHG